MLRKHSHAITTNVYLSSKYSKDLNGLQKKKKKKAFAFCDSLILFTYLIYTSVSIAFSIYML